MSYDNAFGSPSPNGGLTQASKLVTFLVGFLSAICLALLGLLLLNVSGSGLFQFQTRSGTAANNNSPFLSAEFDQSGVRTSGFVPNLELASDFSKAQQRYFGTFGINEISVDPDMGSAEWTTSFPELLGVLSKESDASIRLSQSAVEFSGEFPTDKDLEKFESVLAKISGLPVSATKVRVSNQLPPKIVLSYSQGAITMSGVVPTEGIRQDLVSTAEELYGEESVTDSIEVDPDTYWAIWMEGLPRMLQFYQTFDRYDFQINGREASGTVVGGVEFEPNSAVISSESEQSLKVTAGTLLTDPGGFATVVGYVDSGRSAEEDLRRSKKRAQAVVDFFVKAGVSKSRLTAIGRGSRVPPPANSGASADRIGFIFGKQSNDNRSHSRSTP